MTQASSSFGTLFQMGDGGTPETFTTIAELGDIKPPELKANTEDATHHSSPGSFEEHVVTTLTAGEATFKLNYIPGHATHNATTGLLAKLVNKTLANFKIVFPTAGNPTWAFSAHVTGFKPDAPVKGKLSADVTLKIQGQPTLS